MHLYLYGYLLIALVVVSLGLGYWRAHRLGGGWPGWLVWGGVAVLAGLAVYPFSIPTTPENYIRVDLVYISRYIFPFLSLIVFFGLLKAVVDTRVKRSRGEENVRGGLWLRLITGTDGLKRPLWVGFVFAPLAAVILYFVIVSLIKGVGPPGNDLSSFVVSFALDSMSSVPVSYVGTLLLGPPLVAGLRRLGALGFWSLVLSAIPLGVIAFIGWEIWYWGHDPVAAARGEGPGWLTIWARGWQTLYEVGWARILEWMGTGAAMGFAVAATFGWLTAIHKSQLPGRVGR